MEKLTVKNAMRNFKTYATYKNMIYISYLMA